MSLCILFVVDYHIAYRPDRLEALVTVPKLPIVAGVGLTYYVLLFGVMGRIELIYFQLDLTASIREAAIGTHRP